VTLLGGSTSGGLTVLDALRDNPTRHVGHGAAKIATGSDGDEYFSAGGVTSERGQ